MKKIIIAISITTSLFAVNPSNEVTKLSSGVKSLLSQEMIQVEKSMKSILTDMISGDYDNLSKKATGIQNSFILKKTLTKEQKQELTTKVSKKFFALDRKFHETAGLLASAAEFGDKKEINKYYSKMLNSCVECHSTFATHRFTNFK